MKLLFNRANDGTASSELKRCLSFIDVDIKFQNIKPDVLTATRELIELIGKEIYEIAYNDYNSKTDDKEDLVFMMRYPIAINAYRMYAPNNDIAHTSNGRKMRQDENEKQAFEWMIDRDNEALERKYYRALDDLLHYLENNLPEWKNSEAHRKLQESIFKTTTDFNEHFPLDSRLLLIKLQPGIKLCLRNEIRVRLGDELLTQLLTADITPDKEELYYEVKQACACYAMSWAMPRLSVKLFPHGVLQSYVGEQQTAQARQVPSGDALAYAKQYFESDFKKAIANIETILKASEPYDQDDFSSGTFTGKNFIST